MTAQLSPPPRFRAVDSNGNPIAFGKLTTYAAGTTTPQATYVDSTQTTQNTNPITLNAMGECALWLDPTLTYKYNLTDQFGNQVPGYPVDNIPGSTGVAVISGLYSLSNIFTTSAGQTVFALTGSPVAIAATLVTLDGAVLVPGVDYTIAGSTLTLTNGALANQTLYAAGASLAIGTGISLGPPNSGPTLTLKSATGWGALLSQSTIQVTGPNSLTNANQNVGLTQLLFHGYAAEIVSINGSAPVDQKVWSNYADNLGNYNFRIENDALNATYTYLQVARSGNGGVFGSHQPIITFNAGYGNVTIRSTIAGDYELAVFGGSTAGFSNGLHIGAGTTTGDHALTIVDATNTHVYLDVRGDGKIVLGPSTTGNTTSLTVTGQASSTAPAATFGGTASNFITVTDGAGMAVVAQAATGNAGVIGTSTNHPLQIVANGTAQITITAAGNIGFFGGVPAAKPTVTGSRGGNAALASLLTALAGLGLITDSSTP